MQRRDFVKNTSILTLGLGLGFTNIKNWYNSSGKPLNVFELETVSDKLETDFSQLLAWMKANGWAAYLQQALGVNLDLSSEALKNKLIKKLDSSKLNALRQIEKWGTTILQLKGLYSPVFQPTAYYFMPLPAPG